MIPHLTVGTQTFSPSRVFCIGKNYAEHVRELNDPPPEQPVVFMKPPACLMPPGIPLARPRHGRVLHHEAEVVLLVGRESGNVSGGRAWDRIAGITLGLDLTLRDVQSDLKRKGHPWELSKAFEQSAPIGQFVSPLQVPFRDAIPFECRVNGEVRQSGNTRDMMFPVPRLIQFLSSVWTLVPGDLIFTGTPAGVGPLQTGDRVTLSASGIGEFIWTLE
ncbi:MAG: fumarylacetoacetate hydrolase [Candidatus Omnitrophica bacterium CG11_big_fil_rev_8_21_14_0_20_64_10]|nr:MAG: fumarylacetoacetate hydrolase [Candidatus Omnitrophica bacterium CG11_big_fil_rev_8_21_14_0_20_64_10]